MAIIYLNRGAGFGGGGYGATFFPQMGIGNIFETKLKQQLAMERIDDLRRSITASRELPGSTHWDPTSTPIPVGKSSQGGPAGTGGIFPEGISIPPVGVLGGIIRTWEQGAKDQSQPPVIFSLPAELPGSGGGYYEPPYEEKPKEEVEVAVDWGALITGGINLANTYGQMTSGQLATAFSDTTVMAARGGTGGPVPAKVTVDTVTGKVTPCRRRRRKPLLTDADFAALAKVASLPNNANVRTALAQAIRR